MMRSRLDADQTPTASPGQASVSLVNAIGCGPSGGARIASAADAKPLISFEF
jgi:hypothetical protein